MTVAASDYAGLKTHDRGHDTFWSQLGRLGTTGLRHQGLPEVIAHVPYETYPRGRIVYDPAHDSYRIYADRRLHRRRFIDIVLVTFGIANDRYTLWADQHYARSQAVPLPLQYIALQE